jgi:glycoside/pentoside/hexuronide:cation symporter, GPH family
MPAAAPHPPVPPPSPRAPRRSGLTRGATLAYGAGNFAFSLLGLVVAVNLQFFYTDSVGLRAGLVSWSLLFARLIDAFTDPVMGWLSDRTRARLGRRRPYILASALPLGVAFYWLFTPPVVGDPAAHQGALLAYMLALYSTTYVIWTVGAIPYYSLGAELTDDYAERTRVIAVREAWGLSGLLLATILPAWLIALYGGRDGYSFMGGILGLGTSLFLLASGFLVRERAEFQGRPALGPYQGWAATLANPHFRRILLAFACSAIAGAVPATLVIYVAVYVIGTPDWWARAIPVWMPTWSFYLLVYFGAGVLSLPLWNVLASRLGKPVTWGVAIAVATATSASCSALHEGSVGLFTAILVFGGMAFGNYLALPSSIVADLIDWDEARTGGRREAAYFGVWAFATKFGNAFTGFAALQVLEHVGYLPGVAQTETVKHWMIGMFSWFPAAFYLLSGLALMRFRFTRRDLDEVQRAIGRL